jgi:uncharacterized membrane protein YcaP (DUF421 family)
MNWDTFLNILSSAFAIYIILLIFVRLLGLRSFAEMSAPDLAVTVAIGTVISSTLLPSSPTFIDGVTVLAVLFAIQFSFSQIRLRSKKAKDSIENSPVLIMDSNGIIKENLRQTYLTEDDLMAKLREANAYDLNKIQAVVFETTGDISVLHGDGEISDKVLKNVKKGREI